MICGFISFDKLVAFVFLVSVVVNFLLTGDLYSKERRVTQSNAVTLQWSFGIAFLHQEYNMLMLSVSHCTLQVHLFLHVEIAIK